MSNENSTTNRPLSGGRYRKFSCITYLNEIQLKCCLLQHSNQIRVYAYAFHDKDEREDGTLKEPHFHLIIVTYNTCSLSAIRRWFSGYVDKNGDITTTAQKCSDVFMMYDYLTHKHDKDKYQYSSDIIQTNDKDYFKASESSEYDNVTLAAEMLIKGAKVREVGRIFGRDFILHYNSIKNYVNDVLRFQKYGLTLEEELEREYELEVDRLNNGG